MELDVHPTVLAICRLDPSRAIPAWATGAAGPLVSVTRTSDELSVVIPEHAVPRSVRYEGSWLGMSVRGPLEFSLTGVVAGLSAPLADAGIPIFVVSTFDTDWLLVRADDIDHAVEALGGAGHQVHFLEA
ncbi:MAG: ACT domain-containing protein [Actinobacteria bacterium]|nr:ACT domain-containing protein [Actinomycetota bacterium]